MKKAISIVVLLVLVLTMASCAQGEQTGNTQQPETKAPNATQGGQVTTSGGLQLNQVGTYPIVNEAVTLSVLALPNENVTDIKTNRMTVWVEETTNVNYEWTIIESGPGSQDKVNLMLNSGETLPDLLFVPLSYDQQQLYGEQGIIQPLNDLIEQNCPNITSFFERFPVFHGTSVRADGNIYTVGGWEECFHCTVSQKMYINVKWLENLNLDMPATTEEYYEVLKAFKTGDPNQNGEADELPLSGFVNNWHSNMDGFLMNAFIYNDGSSRLTVNDGKISAAFIQPEWREGIRYYRKLAKEGLIDMQAFVQDQSTFLQLTSGDTIRVGSVQCGHHGMVSDMTKDTINDFAVLPPLEGPQGVQFSAYYPTSATGGEDDASLSSTCKYPELAMRIVDLLFTEEAVIRCEFGEKGVDWDYNSDQSVLGLDSEMALYHTFGKAPPQQATQQNIAWIHMAPIGWELKLFNGLSQVATEGAFDLEKNLFEQSELYIPYIPDEYIPDLSYNAEDSVYVSETKEMLKSYVSESFAQFVIGEKDIEDDAQWEAYLQEIDKMGLQQYIEVVQAAYDKYITSIQ